MVILLIETLKTAKMPLYIVDLSFFFVQRECT